MGGLTFLAAAAAIRVSENDHRHQKLFCNNSDGRCNGYFILFYCYQYSNASSEKSKKSEDGLRLRILCPIKKNLNVAMLFRSFNLNYFYCDAPRWMVFLDFIR